MSKQSYLFVRSTLYRYQFISAPSTDKGKKYGYVFYDCKLTAEPEATKVYLSRPWRPYAQAVFIRCELGKHILPVGWNNWGKKETTVLKIDTIGRYETGNCLSYGT